METKCIICGGDGAGMSFEGLQKKPFFCERCLFLILMQKKYEELAEYCQSFDLQDNTRSPLASVNIWKKGAK